MKAHGKKLFAGSENVKGFFLFDIASVHEVEHPFRHCNHALFIHWRPKKALVLGVWKKNKKHLQQHFIDALGGRLIDFQEERPRFGPRPEYLQQGEEAG